MRPPTTTAGSWRLALEQANRFIIELLKYFLKAMASIIPENFANLHEREEQLREKALRIIAGDERFRLHLGIVESAMDLADVLRQFETDNEDLKVVRILGMRTFNSFASSLKLALWVTARSARL